MKIEVSRVSENTIIVYFGHQIAPQLVEKLAVFTRAVQQHYADVVYEVIPSYTSVLIEYHPLKAEADELIAWCQQQAKKVMEREINETSKTVTLPVYYHPDVAPDLELLAQSRHLTIEQVIDIHSQTEYTVCAIGFAPGFAFLGSVDPRIVLPRRTQPRLKVAKGSVGIADQQTAVYPLDTPGGWQIVGNCPVNLFNLNNDPMMPFDVGDKVRFEPISRVQFLEFGGVL
jgi:KipI family sensor histidine kinase inhibitor